MYFLALSQCTQALGNVEHWLDKAELLAQTKNFDIDVLLTARLAVDMQPLTYQIQSACDYVKGGAARLAGLIPPKHEDNEKTLADVRARIRKTVEFAKSVTQDQYAGADERTVAMMWAGGRTLKGPDYLLQMTIPNTYFHLSMAYAILRHHGVDVGKLDFLGHINWLPS